MMFFSKRDDTRKRYFRYTKASVLGKTAGRWTYTEHLRFVQGLKRYGRQWQQIEKHIGSRTSQQIRSHAQKVFKHIEKRHGLLPEYQAIAALEEISEMSDSEAYMSETGAEVKKVTRQVDQFLKTKGKRSSEEKAKFVSLKEDVCQKLDAIET
jgi:SHAQKYF class myb-like DNA-binding protein